MKDRVMPDIDPSIPDKPVIGPATPVSVMSATGVRDTVLVLSALPTLIAVLGTHNVTQITAYLTGQEFAPALGVIFTAGIIGWRQWLAWHQHSDEVKMADSASDKVAIVKR